MNENFVGFFVVTIQPFKGFSFRNTYYIRNMHTIIIFVFFDLIYITKHI